MSFSDLASIALGAVTSHIGDEVTYNSAGSGSGTAYGVFSQEWTELQGDTPIQTYRPNLLVRGSDLPANPVKGDTVTINAVTYKVFEVQQDGEGGFLLFLHEAA